MDVLTITLGWIGGKSAAAAPPAPSAGNYVQRVIGRTTRAEDFARPRPIDRNKLRRKREEEEVVIL